LMSFPNLMGIWVGSGSGMEVVTGPLCVRASVLLAMVAAAAGREIAAHDSAAQQSLDNEFIRKSPDPTYLSASPFERPCMIVHS